MKTPFFHSFGRSFPTRAFAVALAAFAVLLGAHPAAAQAEIGAANFGEMICNAELNLSPFADLFSVIAYVAGAAFVGQGLHMLVRYSDNPSGMRLSEPLTRLFGGTALFVAPGISAALIQTFFGYNTGGGLDVCAPGAVTAAAGGIGLDTLLTNLVENIQNPLNTVVSVAAVVMGFFMVVRGLMKASKYGADPRENSMTRILSNLIVGSLLMVAGQDFDTILQSLFGAAETSGQVVAGWNFITQLNASQQFIDAVTDAGHFFQMVGMIAFVRGFLIMRGAAEGSGQATMAQGLTHIIGGVLAMNIFGFLQIMDATFGTNFLA